MAENETTGTPIDYRDRYNEAQFKTLFRGIDKLEGKLDEILETLSAKASATTVQEMEKKVNELEKNHPACPAIKGLQKEFSDFKEKEFEPVKKATESAVFYDKHPGQLKMVMTGAAVLVVVYILSMIPAYYMFKKLNSEFATAKIENTK